MIPHLTTCIEKDRDYVGKELIYVQMLPCIFLNNFFFEAYTLN